MHTLWTILACFSGVFAFAFRLAGVQGMQEENPEPPKNVSEKISHVLGEIIFGALGSMLRGIAKNWRKQPDDRRLIYAGLFRWQLSWFSYAWRSKTSSSSCLRTCGSPWPGWLFSPV